MKETIQTRLVEFCGRHTAWLRFVVATLILACGAGISLALDSGSGLWKWPLAGVLLVAAGLLEILRQWVGKELSLGETETARMRRAYGLLVLARMVVIPKTAEDVGQGVKLLRANIMLPADSRCRTLKVWTSIGMDGDADAQLEIKNGTGVAGWVFEREKELRFLDIEAGNIDPRHTVEPVHAQAAVRSEIRSIICAPIVDQQTATLPNKVLKGVLCLDSDLTADEVGFSDEEVQGIVQTVADLLAPSIR